VTRLLKVAAAIAYVIALAALPFGHHDLACHIKSSTHCTTCLVGTSADDSGGQPSVAPVVLDDAGQPFDGSQPQWVSPPPAASAGRSPPVPTLTLV
jgi:hypothetical protein